MSLETEVPVRVMALHALAYCERLFYLEEVEEIRVADERVYAGRTLHEELAAEDDITDSRVFELESEVLGIKGKLDAVRHREGAWIPYEHKRGRCFRGEDKTPQAWRADALQVAAYAMLLEESTGKAPPEGRVRYHADNLTVRVPIDNEIRNAVNNAIAHARELRTCTERPPITDNERLCLKCSLAPVCLPEEERFATDPDWEAVRLFPPNPEGQTVHVGTPGARVGRSVDMLTITGDDTDKNRKTTLPINDVGALVLHGSVQLTTQALNLCAAQNVPVHWFTAGGNYIGGLAVGAGGVQRRIRQFDALTKPEFALNLAKRLAAAKMETQLRYLLRITRGDGNRSPGIVACIDEMRQALGKIDQANSVDSIRGYEGSAARAYFAALPEVIISEVPASMRPNGRSRRPPRDRFNALLSFGYAMLYRSVLQAVLSVGLEPAFGFYHTPRSSAYPLVLDLMELFRVSLWDIALIGSINRKQWDPDADFVATRAKVWLSDQGRNKAITVYERRLAEQWKHPMLEYSLSYARTLELETRFLEKEWTGKPGLFARARLR